MNMHKVSGALMVGQEMIRLMHKELNGNGGHKVLP
jgi:hypothetical protein